MFAKLDLFKKALILVSVPLIFELGFLALLTALLNQSEAAIAREKRARDVIATSTLLVHHFYDAGASLMASELANSTLFGERYEQVITQIPHELDSLDRLAPESPRLVSRIRASSNRLLELLDDARASMDPKGQIHLFIELKEFRRHMEEILEQLVSDVQQLIIHEQKFAEASPKIESRQWSTIRLFVCIGALLSIVIALVLAVVFKQTTVSRLRVVLDNTYRLVQGLELQPVVGGRDEIAHLDQTFHDVATVIREAERTKQDFVNMISHDLRTPLTSMQAALSLMETGTYGTLSSEGLKVLSSAERESVRLINLINQLLDLDKMDSGQLTLERDWVPFHPLIQKSVNAVLSLAERQQIKILTPPDNEEEAFADAGRITQVLVNLLSNAVKFSPPSGQIDIGLEEKDNWLAVTVQDQGPGITPADRRLLFERFVQSQTPGTKKYGTGLGLFISKAIVELHGGTIGVNSKPGMGSTFWFRIPVSPLDVR